MSNDGSGNWNSTYMPSIAVKAPPEAQMIFVPSVYSSANKMQNQMQIPFKNNVGIYRDNNYYNGDERNINRSIDIPKNIDINVSSNNTPINNPNNMQQPTFPLYNSIFIKTGRVETINIKDPKFTSGYLNFSNFDIEGGTNIGKGSFGTVYRVKNKENGINYAVKQINKSHLQRLGEKEKNVIREISTQMSFNHPNIVKVYTYNETPTDFYMVMEDMAGGSLFNKIRNCSRFTEATAFKYFIQAANAVLFLHENMFVHRDIKPENLLLTSTDILKLSDFGWCVKLGISETRTTFCGTVEYMAPEIVKKEAYNKSIDIWALGSLLYEMLHGYSPFIQRKEDYNQGGNSKNGDSNENNKVSKYIPIFRNIVNINYKVDTDLGMSRNCINMIHSCLNPDPEKRITIREIFAHPWVKQFEGVNLDNPYNSININNNNNNNASKNSSFINDNNGYNKIRIINLTSPNKMQTNNFMMKFNNINNSQNNMMNKNIINIPNNNNNAYNNINNRRINRLYTINNMGSPRKVPVNGIFSRVQNNYRFGVPRDRNAISPNVNRFRYGQNSPVSNVYRNYFK